MSEWDVVSSFMSIPAQTPVAPTFDQWWEQMWTPIEQHCYNVAKHSYVMRKALLQFIATSQNASWEEDFQENREKEYIRMLCTEVGLEPVEFIELGFELHTSACRKAYTK